MAYLLGSDYTDGVKGIGIVNAMEILDVFGSQSKERIDHTKSTAMNSRGPKGGMNQQTSRSQGGFFSSFNSEEVLETDRGDQEGNGTYLQNSLQQLEDFKEWLLAPHDFSTLKLLKSKKRKSQRQEDEDEEGEEVEDLQQKLQKIKESKLVFLSFPLELLRSRLH
jgi:5'-3' exonuclease